MIETKVADVATRKTVRKSLEIRTCEFIPETVAYIVKRARNGSTLKQDDFACLYEIANYYETPGGIKGFITRHEVETIRFAELMREAKALVHAREYGLVTPFLEDCMDMLIQWEFLRFTYNVTTLNEMLICSGNTHRSVTKWRRKMVGFDLPVSEIACPSEQEEVEQ